MSYIYLEHYLKALDIFNDPKFEDQDLLLHDWTEIPNLINLVYPQILDKDKYYLVKFIADYVDEFNVYGFRVFTIEEYEEWANAIPDSFEFGFGTNEQIDFESKEDFLKNIEVKEISNEAAKVLFDSFGKKEVNGRYHNRIETRSVCEFGHFPSAEYFGNL